MGIVLNTKKHVLKRSKEYRTSAFGPRKLNGKSSYHYGIDLVRYDDKGALHSDYIIAFADGTVTAARNSVKGQSFNSYTFGNYVEITHANGWKTWYFHMKYGTVKVKKGDKVKAGDVLGFMGNTGYSYGVHLHFQMLKYNSTKKKYVSVNPESYLLGKATIEAAKIPVTVITKQVKTYKVVKGDCLYTIAKRYGTTVNALLKLNPAIKKPKCIIYVGQKIKLA